MASRPASASAPVDLPATSSHHAPRAAVAPRSLSPREGKRLQLLVDRYEKAGDADPRRNGHPSTRTGGDMVIDLDLADRLERLEAEVVELRRRLSRAEARAEAAEDLANAAVRSASARTRASRAKT